MRIMTGYQEDLDDFPSLSAEHTDILAESMVGAYRAESTDQWTVGSGITTKIPPLFDVGDAEMHTGLLNR